MTTRFETLKYAVTVVAILLLPSAFLQAGTFKSDVRLAMREAEAISHAVVRYAQSQNQYPALLSDLVPDYLDYLPDSPWGTAFTLSTSGLMFHISLQLPRNVCRTSELRIGRGVWEVYPGCVLTDEEKNKFAFNQLRAVATACEAYHVDNNEYPTDSSQLIPTYIPAVPDQDPYKRPYNYSFSTSGYTVSSYGRDRQPGGQFWNADTIFTNAQPAARVATRTPFEYAVDATLKFRVVCLGLANYHGDWGTYPDSLSQLFPTYVHPPGQDMDLYNQTFYYNRLTPDSYELGALGKDGVAGTENYEVRVSVSAGVVTPVFTPDLAGLYYYDNDIFKGGLLVQLP